MIPDRSRLKPFPLPPGYACFGCGLANESGLKMTFATDGEAMFSFLQVPQHLCGWSNVVHGGVSATILDEIMSRVVLYRTRTVGVTRSMTMEFLKPVIIGDEITAEGRLSGVEEGRRALAEGLLYNSRGEICIRSSGVFSLMSPDRLREKGIQGEELLAWLEKLVFPVVTPEP